MVDYPAYDAPAAERYLSESGLKVFLSPFEDVRDLNTAGPVPLTCNGGQTHILIDPEGHVYKCLTQERRADRERWRFGNIFEGNIQWPRKRPICYIPCDQFYNLDRNHATKDMWELDVREADIPETVDMEAYRKTFEVPASPLKDFIQLSKWEGRVTAQARGDLLELSTIEASGGCGGGCSTTPTADAAPEGVLIGAQEQE